MREPDSLRGEMPLSGHELSAVCVAWPLLFLGFGAFAACVLIPEWREYDAIRVSLEVERDQMATLRAAVNRERRHLEALQNDPAVIVRLALRELTSNPLGGFGMRPTAPMGFGANGDAAGQSAARFGAGENAGGQSATTQPDTRMSRPAWEGFLRTDLASNTAFTDPQTRRVIMVMSIALIGVALWLPGRSPRRRDANDP